MLYETLAELGADLLADTLKEIESGHAVRTPQQEDEASYYPPLSKQLGEIDWHLSAKKLYNLIRALNPVMSAYAYVGGDVIKIWDARIEDGSAKPGEIVCADSKGGLVVGTGQGLLRILMMQVPGSKRMKPEDFFKGRQLPGERFD